MTTKKEKTTFETLYAIDVSEKTEKKGSLTYLSWACAWAEAKKLCPDINYTVYENVDADNRLLNYYTDGKTCYVKVGVTISGIEQGQQATRFRPSEISEHRLDATYDH